jgi:hypothetical protein
MLENIGNKSGYRVNFTFCWRYGMMPRGSTPSSELHTFPISCLAILFWGMLTVITLVSYIALVGWHSIHPDRNTTADRKAKALNAVIPTTHKTSFRDFGMLPNRQESTRVPGNVWMRWQRWIVIPVRNRSPVFHHLNSYYADGINQIIKQTRQKYLKPTHSTVTT